MMVFGIAVEGQRDAAVYPAIIRRIRHDVERVVARPCGGVPALRKKFVGMLRGFEFERVDKALVIRDSGGKDPQISCDYRIWRLQTTDFCSRDLSML